jgi:four helix bundle protein
VSEQSEALKKRTMAFAVAVMRVISKFPRNPGADVTGRQLAKCATSIGANYHAACCAKSRADFIAKLSIVVEEADEAVFWLELADLTHGGAQNDVTALTEEATELRAIFSRSVGTARFNHQMSKNTK